MVVKRNEKFISRLKPELAKATLPHLRDLCDVVVEMALRQEEMLALCRGNKVGEAQSGQN